MRDDIKYIARINKYCHEVLAFVEGYDFEQFLDDLKTNRASAATVEQIGETAKKIGIDLKSGYNHIPWRKIMGIRDVIARDYEGINWETVWQVIKGNIPELLTYTQEILNDINQQEENQ